MTTNVMVLLIGTQSHVRMAGPDTVSYGRDESLDTIV